MINLKTMLFAGFMLFSFSSGLKAQNLTASDKIELSELAAKWNLYTDAPNLVNLSDYMALWTANNPVLTNPFGTFTGTEAIKKWQEGYNVPGGPAFGKRHSSLNIASMTTAKNEAEVWFDLYLSEVNEIPFLVATARGKMTAVKEGNSWKIKTYTIAIDPGFMKAMEKAKSGK